MDEIFNPENKQTRDKWDGIYQGTDVGVTPAPCEVLIEFQHLLPSSGTALDIACGLGGNALFLAEKQLQVTAMDISAVAIDRIEQQQHPLISTCCEAITSSLLATMRSDVIVVSRYLDRRICRALIETLQPGGLLFYQTFTRDKADPHCGPSNPDYLLASNELFTLFSGLKVLAFSDQGTVGNLSAGLRNESYLVAQKES